MKNCVLKVGHHHLGGKLLKLHLFRIGKSIKTENTLVVDKGWGHRLGGAGRKWGMTTNGNPISFGVMEIF